MHCTQYQTILNLTSRNTNTPCREWGDGNVAGNAGNASTSPASMPAPALHLFSPPSLLPTLPPLLSAPSYTSFPAALALPLPMPSSTPAPSPNAPTTCNCNTLSLSVCVCAGVVHLLASKIPVARCTWGNCRRQANTQTQWNVRPANAIKLKMWKIRVTTTTAATKIATE